ncbi:MAG: redoxin domain-containing protein [Bacteroidales bacterium]
MKKLIALITVLFLAFPAFSAPKKGYEIKIRFGDLKDTVIYLANYYGERTYLRDTADVDVNGKAVFKGDEPLEGGIYIIALGKTKVFEFLIDKSQEFSLETTGPDYVKNMKIKGSPENQWFYDYMHFNAAKYLEAEPWQKLQPKVKNNKDSAEMVKNKLSLINKELEEYKLNFIKQHPESFMASFFNALKEITLPEPPVKPDGKKDSLALFYYYKDHYWDNINLLDERLLRTPFFHGKLVNYLDKLVPQVPDSIIKDADILIEKVRPNKEMFKYFVWYMTNTYETSNVMGFDKVFVHMVDSYYKTNQAYWINPTVQENLIKKSNKLSNVLLGKVAPNMIMLDTNMTPVSMHALKSKYTILYFWDPECGHCKTESPKLKKFYDDYKSKFNLEVYGICADTNMVKMKEYIRKNGFKWINVNGPRSLTPNYHDLYDIASTPVIFVLDDKKTIIAKRLLTDQIEKFLERSEELTKKEQNQSVH